MAFLIFILFLLCFSMASYADNISLLNTLELEIQSHVQYYSRDNKLLFRRDFLDSDRIIAHKQNWELLKKQLPSIDNGYDMIYNFTLRDGEVENAAVAVSFQLKNWTVDNYLIVPAALYNGNRFDVLPYPYNPLFKPDDFSINRVTTITDVPRLDKSSGKSMVELTTGDMSTPAIGVYFPHKKKGLWILTEQGNENGNHGISIKENLSKNQIEFVISSPAVRSKGYRIAAIQNSSDDKGKRWSKNEYSNIRFKLYIIDADSPSDLNKFFFKIRKNIYSQKIIHQLPFSAAFDLVENKYNNESWVEEFEYYAVGDRSSWCMDWQLGWVGGGIATLPLTIMGNSISQIRSYKNLDMIFSKTKSPSGLFYGCGNGLEWCSDCSLEPHPDNLHLLRKNADFLYYFYKFCFAERVRNVKWRIPELWHQSILDLANFFVNMWNKYHQFGQFIDIMTGDILVGNSSSSSNAIAGLVLASKFEDNLDYLRVAIEAGEYYYKNYIQKGLSNGGPGEILQCPDSESSYALLDSYIILYEVTRDMRWIEYARDAVGLFSTWVVSYDYSFPNQSEFARLNMRTSGSVWANVQNKHSAPGICTASGDCLLKLYRVTGDVAYLDLLRDISHNLMQYVSRDDRPIKQQHVGWVNERVNLSDWEGKDRIGEIFYGSTWADVSVMLTYLEVPSLYINFDEKKYILFDHFEIKYINDEIVISNPTNYDSFLRVFLDTDSSRIMSPMELAFLPSFFIKANSSKRFRIDNGVFKEVIDDSNVSVNKNDHMIVR